MTVLYNYAFQRSDNVKVHINDAIRGVEYGCFDRNCSGILIPVKGSQTVWHYRHKGDVGAGLHESPEHFEAKMLINDNIEKWVFKCRCNYCKTNRGNIQFKGFTATPEVITSSFEKNYKVDIGVFKEKELFGAIEIVKTHFCTKEKKNTLSKNFNRFALEVDAIEVIQAAKNDKWVLYPIWTGMNDCKNICSGCYTLQYFCKGEMCNKCSRVEQQRKQRQQQCNIVGKLTCFKCHKTSFDSSICDSCYNKQVLFELIKHKKKAAQERLRKTREKALLRVQQGKT